MFLETDEGSGNFKIYHASSVQIHFQSNQIVDKGNLFFMDIFQVVNEEGTIELEYRHFSLSAELVDLDDDRQSR